ncbi:MAG: hypothetical protein GOMPHAMPRED_006027 [Gomphillus americanus]|uniref:Uncharacterized protein n=1 Tax=Gomphillus americanus TaxID=1940652 RepID=A0A8H3IBY9_9LECA|nr:MAG: hypothetical protein GOMPHAMPRED_006027 [Gomphillus americanus]
MEDLANKDAVTVSSPSQSPGSIDQPDHVSTSSQSTNPFDVARNPSALSKTATSSHPVKSKVTPDATPTSASSRSSTLTREPSSPVLVNPGTSRSSGKMHHSVSPHSFLQNQTRAHHQNTGVPPPPPPASFSISSILSSLQLDASIQDDINSIAEIYGKSRLSMANEYASHRSPIGPGPGVESIGENGLDESRMIPSLTLDTNTPLHHANSLETVEELPTPMSDGSRRPSNAFEAHGPEGFTTTSLAGNENGHARSHDFLSVWQARARQGKASSPSVQGISSEVKVHGHSETFSTEQPSELREDVSGSGGSKAMRQLMRLAGS